MRRRIRLCRDRRCVDASGPETGELLLPSQCPVCGCLVALALVLDKCLLFARRCLRRPLPPLLFLGPVVDPVCVNAGSST